MGPVMAIARPISAIISAIIAGVSIRMFDLETPAEDTQETKSCCKAKVQQSEGFVANLKAAMQFGYGQLLKDFVKWLMIGLLMAAIIKTYIPAGVLASYGQGVLAMGLVVLISIPMYICATASTPIAVGLLLSGISPGAALVFMLTGPATNIATLMIVRNELGNRSLVLYLTSVIVTAILCGLLLDSVMQAFDLTLNLSHGHHDEMTTILYQVSAAILAGLIAFQLFQNARNWHVNQTGATSG